jgi:hypothetical protein
MTIFFKNRCTNGLHIPSFRNGFITPRFQFRFLSDPLHFIAFVWILSGSSDPLHFVVLFFDPLRFIVFCLDLVLCILLQ